MGRRGQIKAKIAKLMQRQMDLEADIDTLFRASSSRNMEIERLQARRDSLIGEMAIYLGIIGEDCLGQSRSISDSERK